MTKNLIVYPIFIIACFAVVAVFVTATSFIQLAAGIIIYPLFVLFAYNIFSHRMNASRPKKQRNPAISAVKSRETEQAGGSSIGIADIDKRVFLKLIGGTGLTLFLFSLFNKKTEDILLKNDQGLSKVVVVDPDEGKKIIPAQSQPLDGYNIAEAENDITSFYGFINKNGAWYILRVDILAGSFRYAKGTDNFPSAWKNRETLEYGYYNDVFRAK